jgi:tetrahydromethanopterin S-methyltransferase subunit F
MIIRAPRILPLRMNFTVSLITEGVRSVKIRASLIARQQRLSG